MATSSWQTAAGVRVLTGKNVKFGEGSHRRSNPAEHFEHGIYQRQGIMVIMGLFIRRDFLYSAGGETNLKFCGRQPTFISVFH
jgi:hypothetical protein